MMNKVLIAATLAFCSAFTSAEDIDFTGTAGSSCAFTNVSAGSLNVTGSVFSTAIPATYDITNNDPATFTVTVPQVTTFLSAPGSATMSGDLVQVPAIASGDNNGAVFSGSNAAGWTVSLTNTGVDSLTHSVSGNITDAEAGAYTVRVPVTCTAV